MLERKREAIAKAEREGHYQGRVPTVRRQYAEIIRLKEAGIRPWEIPSKLGIVGRACIEYWQIIPARIRTQWW